MIGTHATTRRVFVAALAVFWVMATSSLSHAQLHDVYQITRFNNNGNSFNADQLIHIVHPGVANGPVCADIYVFGDVFGTGNQQMVECCACPISPNGQLTLKLSDLTSNHPTLFDFSHGVIKIVSSNLCDGAGCPSNSCDPGRLDPAPNLRAWMTHLEIVNNRATAVSPITTAPVLRVLRFDQSDLSAAEQSYLGPMCSSGLPGKCTCPTGIN